MKGIVFNQLQEFVEGQFGLAAWDTAINKCQLPSQGVYVGTKNYDDAELTELVGYFSKVLDMDNADLVRTFGKYIFTYLFKIAPEQARNAENLRSFLLMVHNIIHVEVNKLYQDSNLPDFDYKEGESKLLMLYRSPRKLCHFSEGLILGASERFAEPVKIKQNTCMHSGCDHCEIEVEFL